MVQATADKYDLCIHVSKYMFYNGSTTTQLLKASPVQLSGKNRMSGKDREQLYLKLENDHYTFEKGIACIISLFPFIRCFTVLIVFDHFYWSPLFVKIYIQCITEPFGTREQSLQVSKGFVTYSILLSLFYQCFVTWKSISINWNCAESKLFIPIEY